MEQYEALRNAYYLEWKRFIETGECDTDIIRPMILDSWKRCRAQGVNPYGDLSGYVEPHGEFDKILQKNKALITLAKPHLDILTQSIHDTRFVGMLACKEGYLLDVVGNTEFIHDDAKEFLKPGARRNESEAGTTAITLCIMHKKAVQVFSAEHYSNHYLNCICYAAPIFGETGELVGVLSITGDYQYIHRHSFGIVIALAKAIEDALRLRTLNMYLAASVDSSEYGMAMLDDRHVVRYANKNMEQYCSRPLKEITGHHVNQVLFSNPPIEKLLEYDNRLFEKSMALKNTDNKSTSLLVNTKSVYDETGELFGWMIITKEKREMHRLIHRMVGAYASFQFHNILGKSEKLLRVIALAKRVAATNTRVLIQGESGTGKELFAQAIHNMSLQREGPFISINCSAIPSELMESELFGYNEGAFTGARKGGMPGKFELAEGGTIFLDEIDSMPLEMQIKLLRVLEENKITRVGGNMVIPVNVRIISASSKNLGEMVREGRIRLDLYYRINTIILDIPPLRERREDIPLLAEHMIAKSCNKLGLPPKELTPGALAALMSYSWPGNIRELANTIERAIIIAGDDIRLDHSCFEAYLPHSTPLAADDAHQAPQASPAATIKPLWQLEREAIAMALKHTGNNYGLAAQLLGVHRNTLRNKLKEYELESS